MWIVAFLQHKPLLWVFYAACICGMFRTMASL